MYKEFESDSQRKWNDKAFDWARKINDPNDIVNFEDGFSRFSCELLNILSATKYLCKGNILDLGCGNGCLINEIILNTKSRIFGLDISERMLLLTRDNSFIRDVNLIQGSILELPFKSNSFNLIFSRGILISHIPEEYIIDMIKEIGRVIKKGGEIILDALVYPDENDIDIIDKNIFKNDSLISIFHKNNFELQYRNGNDFNRINIFIFTRTHK